MSQLSGVLQKVVWLQLGADGQVDHTSDPTH